MKAIVIGLLELRRLARDRIALFFVVLFPGLIILIIGVAIFGASGPAGDQAQVGVLDLGAGSLGEELIERVTQESRYRTVSGRNAELIRIVSYDDLKTVQKDIRRETLDAAIVLPSGYSKDLAEGKAVEVQFLAPTVDPAPVVRSLVAQAIGEHGTLVRAAVFAAKHGSGDFDGSMETAEVAAEMPQAEITVSAQTLGEHVPERGVFTGFTYPATSQLILFVFISSLAGAGSLVEQRLLGIPRRMLATPTSSRTVLAGVALGRFVIAAFQGLFILTLGATVFDVDFGNPIGAAALIAVFTLVGTSASMIAGTTFRTAEQAFSVGPPIGIAMGMLGGCMWPLEIVPPVMRTAGHVTPHAWAMDAWIDLIGRGESIAGILPQLLVLAGFVVVLLPLATRRLRKTLTD